MIEVIIKTVKINCDLRWGIYFPFDYELKEILRKNFQWIRWSKDDKCWHLPRSESMLKQVEQVLAGKAIITIDRKKPEGMQKQKAKTNRRIQGQLSPEMSGLIKQFVSWLEMRRFSKNTISAYADATRIFFLFYKDKKPEEICEKDVEYFNNEYIIKGNYSSSYQNIMISAIKTFYKWDTRNKMDIKNLIRPKREHPLPKVIDKGIIKKLLSSISNVKHKTALSLIYSCGLRRSELISLKLQDIDSKRKTMTIINSKGKKDRVLPLSDKQLDLIIRYYRMYRPEKYLFEGAKKGEPYSATSLEKIFHRNMARIQKNHIFTLHCLRHSYATHLLEDGVDIRYIQELLGHKSSRTTEIYTWVSMKSLSNIKNPLDDFDL